MSWSRRSLSPTASLSAPEGRRQLRATLGSGALRAHSQLSQRPLRAYWDDVVDAWQPAGKWLSRPAIGAVRAERVRRLSFLQRKFDALPPAMMRSRRATAGWPLPSSLAVSLAPARRVCSSPPPRTRTGLGSTPAMPLISGSPDRSVGGLGAAEVQQAVPAQVLNCQPMACRLYSCNAEFRARYVALSPA